MLRCCNMSLVTCHTLMMLRCNMSLVTCDTLLKPRCNMSLVTCHTLLMLRCNMSLVTGHTLLMLRCNISLVTCHTLLMLRCNCLLSFYFQVSKVRRVMLTFESWAFRNNLLTGHQTHEISTATPWVPKSRGCYHVWIVHHLSHKFCLFIGLKHTWQMMVYHDATEALRALLRP